MDEKQTTEAPPNPKRDTAQEVDRLIELVDKANAGDKPALKELRAALDEFPWLSSVDDRRRPGWFSVMGSE